MKTNLKIQFNKVFRLNVVILGVFLLFGQVSANTPVDNGDNYLELEREVINQLNQERVDHDLAALQFDNILKKAAGMKLDDMVSKEYFAHTSPEGKGPWHWFERAGYDYEFAGENLATKFTTASEVHKAWMNSKTHRENILFPKYKDVAVMIGKNASGELVAVELFGERVGDDKNVLIGGAILPKNNKAQNELLAETSTSIIPDKVVFEKVNKLPMYNISFNNALLLFVGGLCFILVVNVWILEKEEEKVLMKLKNSV